MILRALDLVTATRLRTAIVLAVLALAATLPGLFATPPLDRDEPRFAQASRQMLETGDLVDIRFQQEARHNKPVGIYWLQAASAAAGAALGVADAERTIGLYRIPSALGILAAVLATFWAGRPIVGRRAAFLGAAGLAGCILVAVEGRLAKTDAVLLATAVIAFGGLARAYLGARRGETWPLSPAVVALTWAAVGASVLIKGPVVPMILALAAGALALADRDAAWLKRLRPALGLAIVVAMAAPWLGAIAWKTGGGFFADSLGQDLLAKAVRGQENHGAPPGAFVAVVWGTFWPLAPFAAAALPALWAARTTPEIRFLAAWAIPAWLLFEAVPTKLPHYVLPLYPALALALGWALTRDALATGRWWARAAALLLPALAIGLAAAIALLAHDLGGGFPWRAAPFAAVAVLLASAAAVLFWRGAALPAFAAALAASLAMTSGVFGVAARDLAGLFPAVRLADAVTAAGCPNPEVATAGFREPSLVLLTRTDLKMTDGAGAAAFLAAGGCRVAFVERRQRAGFDAARGDAPRPRLLATVTGLNINGGRRLSLDVLAAEPAR